MVIRNTLPVNSDCRIARFSRVLLRCRQGSTLHVLDVDLRSNSETCLTTILPDVNRGEKWILKISKTSLMHHVALFGQLVL